MYIHLFACQSGLARPGGASDSSSQERPRNLRLRVFAGRGYSGRNMRALNLLVVLALAVAGTPARSDPGDPGRVRSLKITILSTMLADGKELGEWGFSRSEEHTSELQSLR